MFFYHSTMSKFAIERKDIMCHNIYPTLSYIYSLASISNVSLLFLE